MHIDVIDSSRKGFGGIDASLLERGTEAFVDEQRNKVILHLAIRKEVQRRWLASGWFWRRKLKPEEYNKWCVHHEETEALARKFILNEITEKDDPIIQEIVRRLQDREDT